MQTILIKDELNNKKVKIFPKSEYKNFIQDEVYKSKSHKGSRNILQINEFYPLDRLSENIRSQINVDISEKEVFLIEYL